jgi:hypothetical protein
MSTLTTSMSPLEGSSLKTEATIWLCTHPPKKETVQGLSLWALSLIAGMG